MASVTRQPFAPLDGARLKNLTSLKNRQNAVPNPNPVKRKASESFAADDFENLDPKAFSKRSKADGNSFFPSKDAASSPFVKPSSSSFILTKSNTSTASPSSRSVLNPKSPASKLNIATARSTPLSAPAGRSPTRGKRAGILSSSRRRSAFGSRVDPPSFGLSSSKSSSRSTPFSLDAALKGTLSSYAGRTSSSAASTPAPALSSGLYDDATSDSKSSWFFDIHEDTPEQEMTNLLQHSTCVLDISSDEESESKRLRERAEGKENVPPMDDVSQTGGAARTRASRPVAVDESDMAGIEKERSPLGEMDVKAYYSEGCDENSVVIVPGEEDEGEQREQQQQQPAPQQEENFEFAPQLKTSSPIAAPAFFSTSSEMPEQQQQSQEKAEQGTKTVDELMQKPSDNPNEDAAPAPPAAVLEPMQGTGESFEVWESGSAKGDENSVPSTPTPVVAEEDETTVVTA